MTGEQCTSFQEGLLDVINFLVSPDESYGNQMIDFSFLFTIATGCEGIAASDSVCTTQGEFGCFVVDESNLIAVSVIDYLNNFNRFKRMESTMSMGAANQKFHRYNRYTSDFVRSLCDPSGNDDDDASSTSSELSSSTGTKSARSDTSKAIENETRMKKENAVTRRRCSLGKASDKTEATNVGNTIHTIKGLAET